MSIETTKLMNLADGKVLYDDLRGRVDTRANSTTLAPAYDSDTVYQENDLCTHDSALYKHKSWGNETPAAEDWDITHWDVTDVETEFGGGPSSSAMIHYGYCETAAATDTKTCLISTVDSLFEGLMVRIRFKYGHTGTGVLQLNVSNTGNKNVVYSGTDYASVGAWGPGSVLDFLYDGTNWIIVDGSKASTSRYGRTKLVNNLTTTSDSTALTATQGKVLNDTKLNIDQGSGNAGKLLGVGNDGNVSPVTVASFGGATSSTAGTSGYVPAPSAGDQLKYLCADGSWEVPPGAKPVPVALDTVTNSSGSYTHTTACEYATAGMKPILIELSDPNAFCADITVTVTDGYITLSCDKVIGTSDVTVSIMKTLNPSESDPPAVTSSEFDILANRIGTLSNLTTTAKTNIVSAVNELDSDLGDLSDEVGGVEESIAIVINGTRHPAR